MPTQTTRRQKIVVPAAALLILVSIWQVADIVFKFNPLILPAPSEVWTAAQDNYIRLAMHTGITMFEALMGFLLGTVLAYVLAVAFVHSHHLRNAIYPYAIALKATPLIVIAPLLVIWLGDGIGAKIVMSALVAFFPVLVNSVTGLTAVDQETMDLMRSLSASRWQILIKIRLPASLGYVFASLKTASSLAVVGAIIAEFTGATVGVGSVIKTASYYFQTPLVFAGVVAISLGGIALFGAVAWLERRVVYWQEAR